MMYKCLIFNVSQNVLSRTVGGYRIAHILRDEGWDAEVIDYVCFWSLEELKALAQSRITSETKFIGFSHLFFTWPTTVEHFSIWLKEQYPDVVLISGAGVYPTVDSNSVDYYIQGFGENAIMALVKWLFSNGERPRFSIFNKKVINANDQYPAFPLKSLMVKYEDRDYINSDEWLTVEFSRGCKFKCDFCNFPVLGVKGDYSRDALDLYVQLKDAYDRFGVTSYVVADETFNDRTEKITKFADAVNLLPFQPWFSGFLRADLLISRPQDKEELLRMNFLGHHYGVESFNKESSKLVGKGMDPERIQSGLIDIKNYFENNGRKLYRGTISFVIGLPYDTEEGIYNTVSWLKKNWQGHSFIPFTLQIPHGHLDNVSLIGLDYKKYGYTEISEDKIKAWSTSPTISPSVLHWQNEHMDCYKAAELESMMFQELFKKENKFSINCWNLSSRCLIGSIYDRLKHTASADLGNTKANHVALARIKTYKHKKLS